MQPVNLGPIPTPALAAYALERGKGSMMITGSHIPFDRNGYKTYSAVGELLKDDEGPIDSLVERWRRQVYDTPYELSPFDTNGLFKSGSRPWTDFVRAWRQGEGQAALVNAFVPLAFGLGEAFQFDWSEEGLVVGGIYYRLQVSHMKLCASRAFWLVAYPSQGHEMLFDAHTRSFAALGGIPRRGIYDNMKTAVDKVKKGKGRTVNERFATMCAHYLFDPDFCNVASGWEKGVVEKNVQDSRRRVWMDAAKERFGNFIELNTWLGQRCRAV